MLFPYSLYISQVKAVYEVNSFIFALDWCEDMINIIFLHLNIMG